LSLCKEQLIHSKFLLQTIPLLVHQNQKNTATATTTTKPKNTTAQQQHKATTLTIQQHQQQQTTQQLQQQHSSSSHNNNSGCSVVGGDGWLGLEAMVGAMVGCGWLAEMVGGLWRAIFWCANHAWHDRCCLQSPWPVRVILFGTELTFGVIGF